jgi:DNA-binding SARP family transcriptional activator
MDQQIRTPIPVTDGNPAGLKIELLGGLRVITQAGEVQEIHSQLSLLAHVAALLALTPDRRLRREQIASRLWPGLDADRAVERLQRVLVDVPRATSRGSEIVACPLRLHVDQIEVRLDHDIAVDVEAFEQAASIAMQSDDPAMYRAPLDLYTGDLLPNVDRDEVVIERRRQLRERFLSLLLDLARLHEEMGNPGEAIEVLQRAVVHDPAHEPAHISLMRLFAHTGQRHRAIRQYEELRQAHQRHFGAGPSSLADRIFSDIMIGRTGGSMSDGRTDRLHSPTGPRGAVLSNVPLQLTSFIGAARRSWRSSDTWQPPASLPSLVREASENPDSRCRWRAT